MPIGDFSGPDPDGLFSDRDLALGRALDNPGTFQTSTGPAGGAASILTGAAFSPWSALIAVGFVIAISLTRPNGKDRRSKGFAFEFAENPGDPNEVIRVPYGIPTYTPPVLARWLTPQNFNSLNPAKGEELRFIIDLGDGGPTGLDGRELNVWMNDQELFDEVTTDSPLIERRLIPVDTPTSRIFAFPKANVVPSTVVIFKDGVVAFTENGGTVADIVETSFTDQKATAKAFVRSPGLTTKIKDETIPKNVTRYGAFFPTQGVVSSYSVKAVNGSPRVRITTASGIRINPSKAQAVPESDVALSTAADGTQYFYLRNVPGVTRNFSTVTHFLVTYTVRKKVIIENDGGSSTVNFQSSIGSAVQVTASYRTSIMGEDMEYDFRNGARDQEELQLDDGVRNAFAVNAALTKNTARDYSSENEVHDLVVGIASGAAGFFQQRHNSAGTKNVNRTIILRFKESDATDQTGNQSTLDPSTGWIDLALDGKGELRLEGQVNGTARWHFSVADLFRQTSASIKNVSPPKRLPLKKYDVRVIALDAAGVNGKGQATALLINELELDHVTEVVFTRLNLPNRSTLMLTIKDLQLVPSEPVFTVSVAGRRVWIPDADAVYDPVTERPEPGAHTFTRNPVWIARDSIARPVWGTSCQ